MHRILSLHSLTTSNEVIPEKVLRDAQRVKRTFRKYARKRVLLNAQSDQGLRCALTFFIIQLNIFKDREGPYNTERMRSTIRPLAIHL